MLFLLQFLDAECLNRWLLCVLGKYSSDTHHMVDGAEICAPNIHQKLFLLKAQNRHDACRLCLTITNTQLLHVSKDENAVPLAVSVRGLYLLVITLLNFTFYSS
jgi:hypothetical protein